MRPSTRPSADQDRALMAQAVADPSAYDALIRRFSGLVWSLCRRMSPTPDDSFQAAWARLLGRLDRYNPSLSAPSTWITTVVHRMLIDEHRRRGKLGEVLPLAQLAAPERDLADQLDRARQTRRLDTNLSRLPDAWRRVIVMHHLHGVSVADLAAEEDVAIGTIKSRLHRGRARLAALMGVPT